MTKIRKMTHKMKQKKMQLYNKKITQYRNKIWYKSLKH